MAPQLFVYYRLRADDLGHVQAALRSLHAAWRAEEPELRCELLQRLDSDASGLVTLMEIYRRADGVEPSWQRRIQREANAALAAWLVGERHVEVFSPCA